MEENQNSEIHFSSDKSVLNFKNISTDDYYLSNGEVVLWLAVLRRAIQDAICGSVDNRRSARRWFNDRNSFRVGSFNWVCFILDWEVHQERICDMANNGKREDFERIRRMLFVK